MVMGTVAVLAGLGLMAGPVAAESAKGSPPGNNGTIKIDGHPFEPGEGDSRGAANRNEPHVGCEFQLELYNYEQDSQWKVEFDGQAPTAGDVTVASGADEGVWHDFEDNDPATGASAEGIDHTETYQLDFGAIEPHPQQGFHVKVTVWVDDPAPQGAEVKHKVFWVEPCETEVAGQVEEEKKAETKPKTETKPKAETKTVEAEKVETAKVETKTVETAKVETKTVEEQVLGTQVEREVPARATEVQGVSLTRPAASGPQVLSRGLARTGAPFAMLTLLGLMAIGTGAAAMKYGRR